ncbi:MAG: alpha/beta hydrolase [Chitinophagaceae bacterium]|nr:MAG: alpha/beta hydrolase [Chitinophagaceae bacterium]
MKSTYHVIALFFCCLLFSALNSQAQERWGSYARTFSTKGYEGKKFRLQADIKAQVEDDSASARLWARVDKKEGSAFFNNMWNTPVRTSSWQTYTINGTIDPAATQIYFGALTELNGKFYYDNVKLSIETKPGTWETVYSNDFEKDLAGWSEGIGMNSSGVNKLYKTSIQTDASTKSRVLLMEGTSIPNYGDNKKVGKYANVNGIKLYYEVYGQGAPLVILHGNGGSIGSAGSHMGELIKKYKVIGIDSRAQGKSGDTEKPLTYDQMAADVNELLNQLNIDSAYIWGQSDGAILCLVMAMDYPKKVKRVVAYAPNIVPDSSAIFGWAVTAVNRVIAQSKDKKEVKLYEMMRDYPNIPYEKLHSISAPCLIMGGDRDVIRPEHLVKMFQNIPNSQLCILPGATHGGAWEQKERFLSIMNDFFLKPFAMPTTEDWFKE